MKTLLVIALWLFGCGSAPVPSDPPVETKPPPSKPAMCPAIEEELPYPCVKPMVCRFQGVGTLTQCTCLADGSFLCGSVL